MPFLVMSFKRLSPLLVLVSIVVLGVIAGLLCGRYSYKRYEQAVIIEFTERGLGAPTEVGDAALGYFLLGGGVGLMGGLAVGISSYVAMKRSGSESYHGLNLRRRPRTWN